VRRHARGRRRRHTRIARRHLEALERSDLGSLPAPTFVKGYLRAYAGFLAIDPEPLLDAYRSELQGRGLDTPQAQDRLIEELSHLVAQRAGSAGRRPWPPAWATSASLGLAALVFVGSAGWLLSRSRGPRPAPATHIAAESAGSPAAAETPRPAGPRAAAPVTTTNGSPRRTASRATLQVSESGVGTAVRDQRLVGRGDRFAEGTQVAFWTRVVGGAAGDVVRHVWFHEGRAVMRAELAIGSANWRTFSRRVLPEGATGGWMVEARGPDGGLLARQEFRCVPEP
jgi:hypothetical protein